MWWLSRCSCCFLSLCVFQSGCYVSFDQCFDQWWLSRCPVAIVHYCCQGVQSKGAHLSQDHQRISLIRFWRPATFFFMYQTLQLNKPLLSDIHASVSQDNMVYAFVWILAISKISQLLDHWPTKCVQTKQDRDDEGYLLFLVELWNIYVFMIVHLVFLNCVFVFGWCCTSCISENCICIWSMPYILYFWVLYLYSVDAILYLCLVDAILYLYLVDAILFLIEAYKQSELIINHSFRLFLKRNTCCCLLNLYLACVCVSASWFYIEHVLNNKCICLLILYLACVFTCWFYVERVYVLADSISRMCLTWAYLKLSSSHLS